MRGSEVKRRTGETDVYIQLGLEGSGQSQISTGIGMLDHMLTLLARHSLMDLTVQAQGDLVIDDHHTVEDIGICLGQALARAVGDRVGMARYGEATVPMDEARARVVLDFSGRPFLSFEASFQRQQLGDLSLEMVEEFFRALSVHAGLTLHMILEVGKNDHHKLEALFKALARALAQAMAIDPRICGVNSSKAHLD